MDKFKAYLILGGIIFIILIVMLGPDPSKDMQAAREKALAGRDPLVAAIEEHNKNAQAPGMLGSWTGGSVGGMLGSVAPQVPGSTAPAINPYPVPAQPTTKPNQNSYYPPPAMGTRPSNLQQPRQPQSYLNLMPPGAAPLNLKNGQKVAFAGINAYAVDNYGNVEPLADGVYPLFNGSIHMIIRGGRKIIVSN
ncbi:MAG: hypothetical protein KGJ06_04635 [Pseudomonadota bacterium]|nr:hypothetical protein [Pseudomonadota bacterium]